MKERIIAIEVNLRRLLQRIEKLRDMPLSYEVLAKIQKVKLKIDELGDLVTDLSATLKAGLSTAPSTSSGRGLEKE